MIRNYFKIAFRQFRKQKMYSAIKIGGFAMSIAACLLIALFIKDELSYDKTFPNGDRIYRIVGEYRDNGTTMRGVDFWPPMAKALEKDFPEIEKAARFMPN